MKKRKIDVAVIAAGGNATRFRTYSLTLPKEMLPLNGKPVIEYVIDECIDAKINKIIIEVKKGNGCIKNHLMVHEIYSKYLCDNLYKMDSSDGIQIVIVEGDTQYRYGNAISILSVEDYLKGKIFAVLFADDIILGKNATKELVEMYCRSNAKAIIATALKNDEEICEYGNLKIDEKTNKVTMLIQKPQNFILSNNVVVSRMILDDSIFKYIKLCTDGESDIGKALNIQAQECDVIACSITGEWVCVDSPQRYLQAMITVQKLEQIITDGRILQH